MGFVEFLFETKKGKTVMGLIYGWGGAVVIIGALFKIMHWKGAEFFLILGLGVEAAIFAISAFEPPHMDIDWSLVYPELTGAATAGKKNELAEVKDAETSLSKKLDDMLKEAGVDANLMESLGSSIKNFEGAAKGIAPTVDAMESTKKYSSEMVQAASQMESLNSLYKVQLESASKQASVNEEVVQNASALKDQMAQNEQDLQNAEAKVADLEQSVLFSSEQLAFVSEKATQKIALGGTKGNEQSEAMVYWNPTSKKVLLDKGKLPVLEKGKQYQLWAIADGVPVDMGMLDWDKINQGLAEMKTTGNAQAFAITIEPEGGSKSPTMEAMVVVGEV